MHKSKVWYVHYMTIWVWIHQQPVWGCHLFTLWGLLQINDSLYIERESWCYGGWMDIFYLIKVITLESSMTGVSDALEVQQAMFKAIMQHCLLFFYYSLSGLQFDGCCRDKFDENHITSEFGVLRSSIRTCEDGKPLTFILLVMWVDLIFSHKGFCPRLQKPIQAYNKPDWVQHADCTRKSTRLIHKFLLLWGECTNQWTLSISAGLKVKVKGEQQNGASQAWTYWLNIYCSLSSGSPFLAFSFLILLYWLYWLYGLHTRVGTFYHNTPIEVTVIRKTHFWTSCFCHPHFYSLWSTILL